MFFLSELTTVSIITRIIVITVLSGFLGFERTRKRRAAGIRTYIIVSLGATLTMMTAQYQNMCFNLGTDMTRLGAQVISGIGFICAGTIIITNLKTVKGITTAAGLWASACIGIAVGAGYIIGAFIFWFMIIFVLFVVDFLEKKYNHQNSNFNLIILFDSFKSFRKFLKQIKIGGVRVNDVTVLKNIGSAKEISVQISLCCITRILDHDVQIDEFANSEGVLFIEEI